MRENILRNKLSQNRPFSRGASARRFSWLIVFLLLQSCSGPEAPSNPTGTANRPPSLRSVKILPALVTANDVISVQVEAYDPDRNALTFKRQWYINEARLEGETQPTLSPGVFKRGDRVAVEVVPFDGTKEGTPFRTEPSVVINAPPHITQVQIEPNMRLPGNSVVARVEGVDADQDEIHYWYRWWRNDKLVKEGDESVLDTTGFGRKDVVAVEVIARDQEDSALPARSALMVLGNSPPQIVSNPAALMNREQYEYIVQAKDVDGDTVTYGLETAPPGMTIDKVTGQVTWHVTPGSAGTHRVKVMADDGQGGTAWQEFEVSIPSTAQSPPSPPSQG